MTRLTDGEIKEKNKNSKQEYSDIFSLFYQPLAHMKVKHVARLPVFPYYKVKIM